MGAEMTPDDVAAIHELIEPWNAACVARDWPKQLSMCTDDMVFMPPDGPSAKGKAIMPWLDALPIIKELWWNIEQIDGGFDTASLRGQVRETLEIDGVEEKFDGKYTDVVRKGSDGTWRFAAIMWNSNRPPATP
jgi:ketosteroid isomerase-like protein